MHCLWHTCACATKQRSCRMTLQSHLAELERRHKAIDRQVEEEKLHPACDTLKLAELKRKKLQIKDEMARLQSDCQTLHYLKRRRSPTSWRPAWRLIAEFPWVLDETRRASAPVEACRS